VSEWEGNNTNQTKNSIKTIFLLKAKGGVC